LTRGPEERSSPEISGGRLRRREEGEREETGLPGGASQSAREGREGKAGARSGWGKAGRGAAHAGRGREIGGAGPRGGAAAQGEKRGERRGLRGSWGVGPTWPMREGERRGELGWAKERKWAALSFPFSSFLFFSIPKPIKQPHLNSNKLEFKPYKFHTRKIMLQHECTNNLIL
jgi:hypothetical protein